jgi:hypothetical protein
MEKPHTETEKDPRFNGIASFTSFAVILEGRLTQSLSNSNQRFVFVFFNTHPLNQASLFRGLATKHVSINRDMLCSETGI